MTRHMLGHLNYPNEGALEYRHPSRIALVPPTSHERSFGLPRSNPRADPMARQTSRPNPAPHVSANSASGTPRRRIPVACGRCRKRKIRCSGDPGDSSGCQNCTQAGVGPGLCVFLRVQCEMRELVPDHVLMMSDYEQVSSATVDLHPYSSSSSTSSITSLALGLPHPHPMHSTQQTIGNHSLRASHNHSMHTNAIPLKSLYHHTPIMMGPSSGDGLVLGITGPRGHYEALGGDMTSGVAHGSSSNGISGTSGDMYNGNYPQYMHPDISQSMTSATSVLHGQHGHWTPLGGRQSSGLYLDQDQASTMQNYMSVPNPPLGTYPMVFPALSSLSSSLPDGISPRTPVNEKVQLPLPIRTQATEASGTMSLRSSPTGSPAVNDSTPSNYGSQSLQSSYRGYPWGGDSSFSSTPQSSSLTIPTSTLSGPSQQPLQTGIPALPAPPPLSTYGLHNPTFPLSSSNSSLLPNTSHTTPSISNSPIDPFPPQSSSHTHQLQKHRSDSESSNGSKAITPTPTMRTNSTSSSSYSPNYSRSSVDMNNHGTQSSQQRRTLGFSKVY